MSSGAPARESAPRRTPSRPRLLAWREPLATRDPALLTGVVAAQWGRRDYAMRRLLVVADAAALLAGLTLAELAGSRAHGLEFVLWGLLTVPMWLVLFKAYGLYDRDVKRVSHTSVDDLPWLFHALVIGSLLMWLYYKVAPTEKLVLAEVLAFSAATLFAVVVGRALVRRLVKQGLGREKVLLVGEDGSAGLLVRKMRSHPEYGLDPIGALRISGGNGAAAGLPVLGRLEDLPSVAQSHGVERVVVSHAGLYDEELMTLLHAAKQLSLKVNVLPQMFDVMGSAVEVDDFEGVTVLGINPPVLPRSSRLLKRGMDIAGSSLMLIALAPLLLAIAIAIKLDSSGPVLFRQRRVGRASNRFELLKFRTMVQDAEQRTDELMRDSEDGSWLKLERDPRITRVGRFLRFTSLDELPQLWNVLRGKMSLVGPRPLIEREDKLIGGWGRSRLDLMPGITGSWQVLGRTNIPFEEMVKLDYLYVTNWSLWTDIRLILHTLPAVLTRRGAN